MKTAAEPGGRHPARGPHPLGLFLALALRQTSGDRARLRRVLQGLRRYQEAPFPPPMPEAPVVARRGTVSLRLVGGPEGAPPLVVVPSLINASVVLDLAPGRSLVRHLVGEGHRVHIVDWGPLGPGERRLGLAGFVSARLLPLIDSLGADPVHLLGYCLGGTLAGAAAALLGERARSLSLIATPWHFDGFADPVRTQALGIWGVVRPVATELGALPVSLLNPLFWSLDEAAVVTKFERLADLPPEDPQISWFAVVEDWNNSGAPLSIAAARDLFLRGFGADAFGRGRWKVGGRRIDPAAIACPIADFVALRDRIVPPSSRIRNPRADRFAVDSGHVGMVVGSAAKANLWQPLSNWLGTH